MQHCGPERLRGVAPERMQFSEWPVPSQACDTTNIMTLISSFHCTLIARQANSDLHPHASRNSEAAPQVHRNPGAVQRISLVVFSERCRSAQPE